MVVEENNTGFKMEAVNELFNIPEENLSSFLGKIEKLNRKIEKMGFKEAYLSADPIGWHADEKVEEKTGMIRKIYEVYVSAENVKMGDYTFIARLSHDKSSGTIIRSAPGMMVPNEYQQAIHTNCDHCHTKRYRTETFVLRNDETGVYVQVGRSCLRDFLGHDIEKLVRLAQYISNLSDLKEGLRGSFVPQNHNYINLKDYLAFVVRELNENAWVARSKADGFNIATADSAWNRMMDSHQMMYKNQEHRPIKEEMEIAENVITYWEAIAAKANKNDYENNCVVIAQEGAINFRDGGYAASMVNAFYRAEKEAQQANDSEDYADSQHIGDVKDRMDFEARVLFTKDFESFYGWTSITKMVTPDGNIITMFGGNFNKHPQISDVLKFRGTVKSHGEYKGIKETVLNRVKEKKDD